MTFHLFLQVAALIFAACVAIYTSAYINELFVDRAERIDQAMKRHPSAAHSSLDELLED